MANSLLNILGFLAATFLYYYKIKPTITLSILNNKEEHNKYISTSYLCLAIYFLLVVVGQFFINSMIISSTCGGNIVENMGSATILTFLPWTLIFGVLVAILTVYPGFKTAFSDVVGYYWVSDEANKLLTTLLINPNVQDKLNSGKESVTQEQRDAMQSAADAIIKICGNTSILINQIFPSNFESYWQILTPLKKPEYQNDAGGLTPKLKKELFDLVVTKDNIGELMWFLYTGLLLVSLVQLKLTTGGCVSNPKVMEQNRQQFLKSEQKTKKQNELATSTDYTITT